MASPRPTASIDIDAPLEVVWAVMMDTEKYGEWNSFLSRIECDATEVGQPIILHATWANGSKVRSPERITRVEPPAPSGGVTRAALAYDFQGWPAKVGLVRTSRLQTLEQRDGGPTTYSTVMTMSGPLAKQAGPGRITEGFERHARELKARAESLAQQG